MTNQDPVLCDLSKTAFDKMKEAQALVKEAKEALEQVRKTAFRFALDIYEDYMSLNDAIKMANKDAEEAVAKTVAGQYEELS